MADILKQIAAAKVAGYTTEQQGAGRWAYNAPNGGGCGTGFADETTAWVKAAAHFAKVGGAESVAKPWAVFGYNVSRYGNDSLKTPDRWKVARVERETATRLYTTPRIDYNDFQDKRALLARFGTEEEAQALVASAKAALVEQAKTVADTFEAQNKATQDYRDALAALNLATMGYVKNVLGAA